MKKIKVIVTLGPATRTEKDLRRLKREGVDFVRVNMSHSSIDDLRYFICLAKQIGIPFVLDTEGSQIRSNDIDGRGAYIGKGKNIQIHAALAPGNARAFSLRPGSVIHQIAVGDTLHIGFDSLVLQVSSITERAKGYAMLHARESGYLGGNKGVVIRSDGGRQKEFDIPVLSEKDYTAIAVGLEEGVKYIAASFMRSGAAVDVVRDATKHSMKVISKVECVDGLRNLDDIIAQSDMLLIDRGDLSKEVPIEKIPFVQKIILKKARDAGKAAFVATNLLETMIEKRNPTLAEVHDVVTTVLEGAAGVTLAAETAIGKYPFESVTIMKKILNHMESLMKRYHKTPNADFEEYISRLNYFSE